ncbi:MAG: hypothetical protein KatS3mg039_0603 [Candidatus Kapaibacterium sp.]|nr:MAG: hypothetical protein KatS3mg039_0603 [Candidatus Kapabacteria bacterium]
MAAILRISGKPASSLPVFLQVLALGVTILSSMAIADQQRSARFSATTLQRGIEAFLREYIHDSDEITFPTPIEDVQFDQGPVVAFCRLPSGQAWGRTEVELSFQTNGQEIKRLRVPVVVTAKRMVPVARHHLHRGQIIGADDVTFELRDVTRQVELLPDSVLGLRLAQSVHTGTVLLRTHLLSSGSVRSGEMLTLVLQSGAITIRTKAQALHAAACGDMLKVRRNDTGAVFVGTLTDAKTVVVDLGTSPTTTNP